MNRKRRLRTMVIGLLVGIPMFSTCFVLSGFTIRLFPQSPSSELAAAQEIWKQQKLINYRMKLTFNSFCYINTLFFTIKDNQVTKVESGDPFTGNGPLKAIDFDQLPWKKTSGCNLTTIFPASQNDYSMNGLFNFAAEKLKNEPTPPMIEWCGARVKASIGGHYLASYQPQRGYITSFELSDCVKYDWGAGLLCPQISECSAGFSVRELTPQ